ITNAPKSSLTKKKLSYKEARELETIEQRIADAERELQAKHDVLQDVAVMSDGPRLHAASMEMDAAQRTIDALYARWVELEQKKQGGDGWGMKKQDWRGVLRLLRGNMSCDNFVRAGKLGRNGAAPLRTRRR